MKKVLCYGDSNTWGYVSGSDGERYDENTRYAKVLQQKLGKNFEVVEEGLPSRTIGTDNISDVLGNRNGSLFFAQLVYSQSPLDFVVVMLGTNDLKTEYNKTAKDCANVLEKKYILPLKQCLGGKIKNTPKIIIVSPAIISDGSWGTFENADKKSLHFKAEYEKIAKKHNCLFVSNDGLENGIDKIHLTKESHLLLANKLFEIIQENC